MPLAPLLSIRFLCAALSAQLLIMKVVSQLEEGADFPAGICITCCINNLLGNICIIKTLVLLPALIVV